MHGKRRIRYIISNDYNTTLYIGVTSDLQPDFRSIKRKNILTPSLQNTIAVNWLIFESFFLIEEAIGREKKLKGGSRYAKIKLIESINPSWKDLSSELL
ncbi:MAG: GIY-YIG nuclease family protein [Bacteroidota bacterium]